MTHSRNDPEPLKLVKRQLETITRDNASEAVLSVAASIAGLMDEIQNHFKHGSKITVVVRFPGMPDRDFIMSSDDFDEVIAALNRRKVKE